MFMPLNMFGINIQLRCITIQLECMFMPLTVFGITIQLGCR
jgi:hypothetical protein